MFLEFIADLRVQYIRDGVKGARRREPSSGILPTVGGSSRFRSELSERADTPPRHRSGNFDPFASDVSGRDFVCVEPCCLSLFHAIAPLRLARIADWGFLRPRMLAAGALAFRRLAVRDSARIAIRMNRTFAGIVGGFPYSFIPFLRRVARKAGVRVTAPRATSPPKDWPIAFGDHPSFRSAIECLRLRSMLPTPRRSVPSCVTPRLPSIRSCASPHFRRRKRS